MISILLSLSLRDLLQFLPIIFIRRCYLHDYLSVLHFLLLEKERDQKSFVIMEGTHFASCVILHADSPDDTQFCPLTVSMVKHCFILKENCKLGPGATFNFFFDVKVSALYNATLLSQHSHIDWYLDEVKIFTKSDNTANHLEVESVMGHSNGVIRYCDDTELSIEITDSFEALQG